jgi:hypothetical protein
MTNEPPKLPEWWAGGQRSIQLLFPKARFSYENKSRLMELYLIFPTYKCELHHTKPLGATF